MKKLTCLGALLVLSTGSNAAYLVNGLGGSAGFGEGVLAANDDGSTGAIDITSVFGSGLNFFGTTYNSLYVNNNGNVTLGSPQSTFTPYAITGATSNPILAPFFSDVDTRGGAATPTAGGTSTGSNLVYWDLDATAGTFTATWDDVGYYSSNNSLLNAYQLILTDTGAGDFDIEFRYESLNWTTGDASGGVNGLGGTVARSGWSSGNGVDYYELIASGDQAQMLNLTSTSNVGQSGIYQFSVSNGTVEPPAAVPVPAAVWLFGSGLLGLVGVARRADRT